MKTLIKIFILLVITTSQFYSQWHELPIGTESDLLDVHFISPEIGWVVGLGSTILKTTDGGNSWISQQPEINGDFITVFFVDDKCGWIGGYNGILLQTSDGGETWFSQKSGTLYAIESLFFTDKMHGYAAVNEFGNRRIGIILQTSNGGINWTMEIEKNGGGFIDIYFDNAKIGWAVGSNGLMFKTTDSGRIWLGVNTNTPFWLHSVFFLGQTGWIIGGSDNEDIILKSVNGGESWSMIRNSDQNSLLMGSFFLNENIGWVCGVDGVILKTENGGKSWRRENANTQNNLSEIFFVENVGYIVGGNGTILKYSFELARKNLELLSPDGDEEWEVGSAKFITWESSGITDVKIEYSYNNGASWNEITASYPSTGIFEWTVPNIMSNQARVRIIDLESINLLDESENIFRIVKED